MTSIPQAPDVVIRGLFSKTELNGKEGVCLLYLARTGRYAVKVEGASDTLLLKSENLKPKRGTQKELPTGKCPPKAGAEVLPIGIVQ